MYKAPGEDLCTEEPRVVKKNRLRLKMIKTLNDIYQEIILHYQNHKLDLHLNTHLVDLPSP